MSDKHAPTADQRKTVKAMTAYGIPQPDVARVIGISEPTLRLHYREELDNAVAEANSQVAQSLFQMATKGKNTAAAIFWLKTRARWKEAPQGVELAGPDGAPLQVVYSWADPEPAASPEGSGLGE